MAKLESESVSMAARRIYDAKLRRALEEMHLHEFVAIEPISGDHFLGKTLSEAIGAARNKHPNRLAHALRIGSAVRL